METIIVKRREVIPGNPPTIGDLKSWKTFEALVAPHMPEELNEVARSADVADFDIYITDTTPSGILSTDVVNVRGDDCEVTGRVDSWSDREGNHVGDQLAVKAVNG